MNSKIVFSLFGLISGALAKINCWSEDYGYPCCELSTTQVEYTDSNSGRKFGIENNHICGINDKQFCPRGDKYKCCKSCDVTYTDSYEWGYENNEWCSIPYTCNHKNSPDSGNTIISTSATTTAATTTTTNTPEPSQCAKEYEMCGGSLYPDSPDCCEGSFCLKSHTEYHQCIPNSLKELVEDQLTSTIPEPEKTVIITTTITTTIATTTLRRSTTTITTTTPSKSTTTTTGTIPTNKSECVKAYQPCGGINYPDVPNCCEEGYFCHKNDEHFHQCIPVYDGYDREQ